MAASWLVLAATPVPAAEPAVGNDDAYQEAFVAFKSGHFDEALHRVDALLLKAPPPARVLELKGRILHRMGSPDKAEGFFFMALERDPELVSAHFHLGEAAFRRKEWSDALQYYLVHLKKVPGAKATLLKVVYCQIASDQLTQAAQFILGLDPSDEYEPGYYFARAALALASGKEKEAADALAQARTIYGNEVFFSYEPDFLFLRKNVTWPKPGK
ncbi:MAG: tetratricopeptide repeat protein [Candidatus Methylacidiphilales bacterium]|nr:tetratricopeptide repeat protein [Candidatus Methylacidiphilales bacterium]